MCTALKNVLIADRDSILTLGSNGSSPLFSSCPLDSVYIGGNINYDKSSNRGYSPFYRNTSLRTVVITDKETEISANEFYGCTNLQDVKIGDGVESFGDWAFSGCSSLKNFSFGMSVATIGKEAFSDCTAMERIFSRSPEPPVCGSQALDDINKWNCVLTVPAGNVAAYKAAEQWKEFFFIEEGEAVKFMLTYYVDGEMYKTLQVDFGAAITPEPAPEKEGYTFYGWIGLPETMPARDVDVTGSLIPTVYYLYLVLDDEVIASFPIECGRSIDGSSELYKNIQNIIQHPYVREGYTFSGWSGEIPYDGMPAHDVTVTGTFSINSYMLTYIIDDEVYKVVEYEYGATITPEPAPEGNYATFEWVGLPETMPAHDVTVHASYETGIAAVAAADGTFNIYTTTGALVRHKATDLKGLPAGVYILRPSDGRRHRGVKVVLKR